MSPPTPPADAGPAVSAAAEDVDLDGALQAELLALEAKVGAVDHFALLGVPPDADPRAVKKAFFELCRRVHPDRYFRMRLGSFKLRIEKVFKAMSLAHQTLTDPEKREAYLTANPSLRKPKAPARVPGRRMVWNKADLGLPLTVPKKDK